MNDRVIDDAHENRDLRRAQQLEADRQGLRQAKKGPRPLTEALMKAARALPGVIPDPMGNADSEL